jgi:phosphohistidine phosphatase SixA
MKRLYLLRHAQAEPSHIQGDHARNLTDTGRIDALNVGVYMAEMKYTPDMIFLF